jgi:hypothetical protein
MKSSVDRNGRRLFIVVVLSHKLQFCFRLRLYPKSSRTALGSTQTPSQWVPGVKQPGREADSN